MRLILFTVFLLTGMSAGAQFGRYFKNQTLRFDYYHSGSVEAEYFMADEMILEGPWSGNRKNLIDPNEYGSCRVIICDSASGKEIYTRYYSTLFVEYQATEEAKMQCGNFPESFLMPLPKKPVTVTFQSRSKGLLWTTRYEGSINPAKDLIKTGNTSPYPSETLLKSGNPSKKLDLVFLPEGYTENEMPKFLDDCMRFTGYLFATDPFGNHMKDLNIYAVLAPSPEPGTDFPSDSIDRQTLLSSSFSTFNTDRYLMTTDFKKVRDIAGGVPYDQIIILVNHPEYGGGGIYNFYAISTADHLHSGFVFTHEFGHSFAGLGDEYSGSGSNSEDLYFPDIEPWEPNITTLADFDSKWKDMLAEGTPVPTPDTEEWQGKTGVFEGAGYMTRGVYRPYRDCSMNVVKFNNFCPVCQRTMARMIGYYTGR